MNTAQNKNILIYVALAILVTIGVSVWVHESHKKQRLEQIAIAERKRLDEEQAKQLERDQLAANALAEQQRIRNQFEADDKVLADLGQRWSDAYQLCTQTSRIALSTPMASLQQLKREAIALQLGPCMTNARNELVLSMGKTIEAFLVFMGESKSDTSALFNAAKTQLDSYLDRRRSCKQEVDKLTST